MAWQSCFLYTVHNDIIDTGSYDLGLTDSLVKYVQVFFQLVLCSSHCLKFLAEGLEQ